MRDSSPPRHTKRATRGPLTSPQERPTLPKMSTNLPYRPCVGVVLANAQGLVLTGERIDTPGAWQMPQGGVDDGEALEIAALRELEEETGVPAALVTIEAHTDDWITYDLPDHLVGCMWKGRYRGQAQKWFLLRYHGQDSDINIAAHDHEFSRWRWSTPDQVLADIVPFKRHVYQQVIDEFRPRLALTTP